MPTVIGAALDVGFDLAMGTGMVFDAACVIRAPERSGGVVRVQSAPGARSQPVKNDAGIRFIDTANGTAGAELIVG